MKNFGLDLLQYFTMVEENLKFKCPKTHQNEGFWVEAHSILHHVRGSEMHQNEDFWPKSTSNT